MEKLEIKGDASLAEEVADVIRRQIITGAYNIGEKLIENKIAKDLKVSRTPVREAFRQLEKEELVQYEPNKGYFAKGFSTKDMSDIYAVRKAVEGLAITWAIQNATDDHIDALKEQLDLMCFYTENNHCETLLDANEEFHSMIYRMTDSRFIVRILRAYQDYVHIARETTLKKEENLEAIYQEHKAIYDAIKSRDIPRAVSEVEKHLDFSRRRAEERWKEKKL